MLDQVVVYGAASLVVWTYLRFRFTCVLNSQKKRLAFTWEYIYFKAALLGGRQEQQSTTQARPSVVRMMESGSLGTSWHIITSCDLYLATTMVLVVSDVEEIFASHLISSYLPLARYGVLM